jgi:RNA polymerase sigma factor (sigma-70 family)
MRAELAKAYREYLPLLLGALARLARSGYVVRPSDALEFVHDFFLEAWGGLQERYRPELGSFRTYVWGAFVRFARPRIVREGRWRDMLCPVEEVSGKIEALCDHSGTDRAVDLLDLRSGLDRLPAEYRTLLARWVESDLSEREAAKRCGISRYSLRMGCAEAMRLLVR